MEKNKSMKQRPLHNVIVITGPKGAGKTTFASIIARWASSDNTTWITQNAFAEKVIENKHFLTSENYKVLIIEECLHPYTLERFIPIFISYPQIKFIVTYQADNYKPSEKEQENFQWICLPNTQNTIANLRAQLKKLEDGISNHIPGNYLDPNADTAAENKL